MKITSLNSDCMQLIFEHLDLNDLLNIADSSKHFHHALCQVYKRKYMERIPIVDPDSRQISRALYGRKFKTIDEFVEWDVSFYVLGKHPEMFIKPILVFKLLRNFGHMIHNFGINFDIMSVKCCIEIENYMIKYCSKSLQRLSILCKKSRIPFENLHKPFQNVTDFKICLIRDQNVLGFVNEINLPNLKRLLVWDEYDILHQREEHIHYENIEYFTLYSGRVVKFPFSFGKLKHLTLPYCTMNDTLWESISNIKHLKTIKILNWNFPDEHRPFKLLELKNIQSNVEEMCLRFHVSIHPDDIFRFLNQSKNIRKMVICHYSDSYGMTSFINVMQMTATNLDERWKCYFENPWHSPYSICVYKAFVIEKIID